MAIVHGVTQSDTSEAAEHVTQSQVPGIKPWVSFRSHILSITASKKTFKLRPQGLENQPMWGGGDSACVSKCAPGRREEGPVCVCVCVNICSRQKGRPALAALGQE